MTITQINCFTPRALSFRGTLNDSVKEHINGTVKKDDKDSADIANATIEELENYLEDLHPDTELRNKNRPKEQVEFYNSLLDITVPIARRPGINRKGQRQLCIPESYPYYLSKRAVKSCRQFSRGLNMFSAEEVDTLFLYSAVSELAKNAKSSHKSAKAWYRTKELMDAIIEYQKNAEIDKPITRKELRKLVNETQK